MLYYINKYPQEKTALLAWYNEFLKQELKKLNELKIVYGNASIVASNRIIFNSKGNGYRLIVSVNFKQLATYIIWFGTHKEYDKIDAETIEFDTNSLTYKANNMNWKVIKTEAACQKAVKRTIAIFQVKEGTPQADELALLLLLVKDYEDKNISIPKVNPIDVIKLKMQENGIKAKDLEPVIGSKGHVSSILSGRREITLKVAQRLRNYFKLPAEIFLPTA